MAFNAAKVEQTVRERGITVRAFYSFVYQRSGNQGFKDIRNNTNPKAEAIERIADLLECSIDDLFDREKRYSNTQVTGNNNTISSFNVNNDPDILLATIKHLQDVITRQDKTIEEKNQIINKLIELAKSK